jgi:hypothetical protein
MITLAALRNCSSYFGFILVSYFNFIFHFSVVNYASVNIFADLLVYMAFVDAEFEKTKNLNTITWTCLIFRGLYEDL